MLSLKNKHSNPKKGCLSNVVAFFTISKKEIHTPYGLTVSHIPKSRR